MTAMLVQKIADLIEKKIDIAAEADPETGRPVLVMREGTFETAARAVLEELGRS